MLKYPFFVNVFNTISPYFLALRKEKHINMFFVKTLLKNKCAIDTSKMCILLICVSVSLIFLIELTSLNKLL